MEKRIQRRPSSAPALSSPTPASTLRSRPFAETPHAFEHRFGHDFAHIPVLGPLDLKENRTGLPDALKAGAEALSGIAVDDVRVHYNSSKPGEIQAWAYTSGADIHVSPGQEHQLPHEIWHVIQQKQGRVPSTMRQGGLAINADRALESEADVMGERAARTLGGARARACRARSAAAPHQAVLQARWIYVPGSGSPGQYYWEGRGAPSGSPPNGGAVVAGPGLQSMEDTHKARSGGSMKSLRTEPDSEWTPLNNLAHYASQAQQGKGLFYTGPTEQRGLGQQPVLTNIPPRDKGEHTKIFGQMTGGEKSSTKYQQSLNTAEPNTKYNILHGFGHGEGGKQTQSAQNLASASEGANTEMIPYDKAISGNPNVLVGTSFNMRQGTHRAESINQSFAHKDFPDEPFFQRNIDGDRPKPTKSEYESWEMEAERFSDPANLDAAVILSHFPQYRSDEEMLASLQNPQGKQQSTWGRLGQWSPGSHPLDFNSGSDDDDDSMIT